MQAKRAFLLGAFASAALLMLPAKRVYAGRARALSKFIDAVLVGAVSGYVAARVAERSANGAQRNGAVPSEWHTASGLSASQGFQAIEYPSGDIVSVPRGRYAAFHSERKVIVVDGRAHAATIVVVKNHNTKRLIGVFYV